MNNFSFLLSSDGGGTNSFMPFLLIIGVIVILYFFMIRPQKKREKEEAAMRDAIQVGDEVTTIGGIIGKIVSIKGETFVLETTKSKTKIRFLKGAIRSVDVRAADIAAAVLETREADTADEADTDVVVDGAPVENTSTSKRAARRARRAAAEAAAEVEGVDKNTEATEKVEETNSEEN